MAVTGFLGVNSGSEWQWYENFLFFTSGIDKQQQHVLGWDIYWMDFASVFAEVNDRRPIDFNSISFYASLQETY